MSPLAPWRDATNTPELPSGASPRTSSVVERAALQPGAGDTARTMVGTPLTHRAAKTFPRLSATSAFVALVVCVVTGAQFSVLDTPFVSTVLRWKLIVTSEVPNVCPIASCQHTAPRATAIGAVNWLSKIITADSNSIPGIPQPGGELPSPRIRTTRSVFQRMHGWPNWHSA